MVAFEHGLGWVVAAALISGAGMGLLSPALTVVVQNSVAGARMGSATTSQQLIIDASLAPLRTATLAAVTVHPTLPRVVFTLPRSRQQPSCALSMSRLPVPLH